jgi:4-amino-4-deoxy-L-arabinose transferase-like glycosyltransferase
LIGARADPGGRGPHAAALPSRAHPSGKGLALLLALCAPLFFLGLGTLGLTDRDEGSNAEAAREMVESGDWITPTLNGAPRFAKPILIYWLISGSYLAFGVSEFTARLPSALFGTLLVLMQYAFATRMFGSTVGLRAALMLLLNIEVLAIGRMVLTDMVLVFFTTLSIFSFFLAMQGEGRAKRWYWGFYIGMAMATLTKGPVGVLVPLLAVIPYLLFTRRWREIARECRLLPGTAVFLLIAAPWYAAMFLLHGAGYAESARGDTFTRFFSVIGGHGGTILFYIPILFLGFFPWSGFLPAALVQALRGTSSAGLSTAAGTLPSAHPPGGQRIDEGGTHTGRGDRADPLPAHPAAHPPGGQRIDEGGTHTGRGDRVDPLPAHLSTPIHDPQHALQLLCAIWVLGVFIFFTLSSTRLPHYIAPLFPAAALLVAASWDRSLSSQGGRAGAVSLWLTLGVGCLLGLAFVGLDWSYQRFNTQIAQEFPAAAQVDPGWAPMAIGFLILGGMGLFGYAALTAGRAGLSFGIASGLMVGIALLLVTVALPRFNQYFIEPPQVLADIAGLNLEETDTLVVYGRPKPSLLFYAKRRCPAGKPCIEVIKPGEEEKLRPVLDRPGQIIILTLDRLRAKLPAPASTYQLVMSRHGYVLLAKKPVFKS